MVATRRVAFVALSLAAVGCGSPAPTPAASPAPAPVASAPASPSPSAAPNAPEPAPAVDEATAPVSASEVPLRRSPFPPPDVPPPFARSAAKDDGRWVPFGDAQGADGKPLLVTTTIHPHEASSFITLTVVAADLSRLRLDFLPGVDDVGKLSVPFTPGLVPSSDHTGLVAVFNGGFMPRHGRWGMQVGDITILPPRDPGCTVAIATTGAVQIRSWPALAAAAEDFAVVRQTPPCLLEQGVVNPELVAGRDRAWAGQTPGVVTRRRSALGISEDGQTLFYAIGVEAPPKLLATGLAAVGARDAAQLDINWNWTRFLLYQMSAAGKPRVSTTLAEVEHTSRDYVDAASKRDFFFLVKK